jgi:hypothetical protein
MHGIELVQRMRTEFNFEPVIRTAVKTGEVRDRAEAEELLEAFLQWFSLLPEVIAGRTYVMLKGPVDCIFHSLILNTRLYEAFCLEFIGQFIHHEPLDDGTESALESAVLYTVDLLEHNFGAALHPRLQEWRGQLKNGAWVVSCPPKNCGHNTMGQTVLGRMENGAAVVH